MDQEKKCLLLKLIKYQKKGYNFAKQYNMTTDMLTDIEELRFVVCQIEKYKFEQEKKDMLHNMVYLTHKFKKHISKPTKDNHMDNPINKFTNKKQELLNELDKLRHDGCDIPDIYTINDNIEDLELRVMRYTKLHKEDLSPNDYDSGSIFETVDPNDEKKIKKTSNLLMRETSNTISKNISNDFSGEQKCMNDVASNMIDCLYSMMPDKNDNEYQTSKEGLKALATMFLSNTNDDFFQ